MITKNNKTAMDDDVKKLIENLEIDVKEALQISFVWEKIVSSYVNIIKDINNPLLTSIQKSPRRFKEKLVKELWRVYNKLFRIKEMTESINTRYK